MRHFEKRNWILIDFGEILRNFAFLRKKKFFFLKLQKTPQNARNVQIRRVRVRWKALDASFHGALQLCAAYVCAHMWHTKGTSLKISVFVPAVCANTLCLVGARAMGARAPHRAKSQLSNALSHVFIRRL